MQSYIVRNKYRSIISSSKYQKNNLNSLCPQYLKTRSNASKNISIQYVSDIHLEKNDEYPLIEKNGEYLVLAGDIGCPFEDTYSDFLKQQSDRYDKVFIVPGNHEYFSYNMNATNLRLTMISSEIDNVHILNNNTYDICDSLRIIGTPLWTNMDYMTSMYCSDFTNIMTDTSTYITIKQHRNLHKQSKAFIQQQIHEAKNHNLQLVIITHHAPHVDMLGPLYKHAPNKNAYATNVTELFDDSVVVAWICGHTHQTIKTYINGIPCMSNCYGTTDKEKKQYDPSSRLLLQYES
jgi:Icc-related predicted phosphoesterase